MGGTPSKGTALVYRKCGFSGGYNKLTLGSYDSQMLKSQKVKKIESAKLGPMTIVEVYEKPFFDGVGIRVSNSSETKVIEFACVDNIEGWKGDVKSIKVLPYDPASNMGDVVELLQPAKLPSELEVEGKKLREREGNEHIMPITGVQDKISGKCVYNELSKRKNDYLTKAEMDNLVENCYIGPIKIPIAKPDIIPPVVEVEDELVVLAEKQLALRGLDNEGEVIEGFGSNTSEVLNDFLLWTVIALLVIAIFNLAK